MTSSGKKISSRKPKKKKKTFDASTISHDMYVWHLQVHNISTILTLLLLEISFAKPANCAMFPESL
jgi:hypothetical protein